MSEPEWLQIARGELGTAEKAGKVHNPKILEYFAVSGNPHVKDDETAWCSAFVNYCMVKAGYKGTMSLAARSWLTWGRESKPQPGAILIFSRGSSTWMGHVGFYVGETATHYEVLGGNQSNKVTISKYPKASLLGCRMPSTMARSRTVAASIVGSAATGGNVIVEQVKEAQGLAEGLTQYLTWAAYGAAALAIAAFALTAYFRWQDMRQKGR